MEKVFFANNLAEAYLLKSQLDEAEIPCEVQGEHLQSLRWELPFDTSTSVSVAILDPANKSQAEAIVKRFIQNRNREDIPHQTWTCKKCGETVEEQFSECWQCGTAKS